MNRGIGLAPWNVERKFENYFTEWLTKHRLQHTNTFVDTWEGLSLWKETKDQLQKWKIIDSVCVLVGWVTEIRRRINSRIIGQC